MSWRVRLLGVALLAGGAVVCGAQTPGSGSNGGDATCIPGMKDAEGKVCPPATQGAGASPAEKFPYPGSDAGSGGTDVDAPGTKAKERDGKAGGPGSPAAKEFPYPGEASADAAGDAAGTSGSGAGSGGPGEGSSSSSSGGGESSSDADDGGAGDKPKLEDKGSEGKRTKRAAAEKLQTDEQREAEDLKVAAFYLNDGNLEGAYMRAKDAVKMQPDDSEAHYELAMIAQKMKKKDEALAEYQAYLKMDPDGVKKKEVQRALSELK